jgi:uncharacterized repeat protein (TIGR01451 family)
MWEGGTTRYLLLVLATAVSITLLASGVAVADTVTADFDSFNLGTVNGQDGWTSAVPGDIPGLPNGYDQAVVLNSVAPPAFGGKSLRHSNAYNEPTGEFQFQTYSKRTTQAAGEYTAKFSFISTSPNAQQPGLRMSVSPDSGVGGRMSFIGLRDTQSGIDVTFYDTPEPDGEFVGYDLGTLRRDTPHTIKFWIKLNPGPDNDLVRIYVDGVDVGQCFTTWENFYPRVPEPVPAINSLQFRSSGGEVPSLVGGGYLFDNVTITTANGAGPAGCPTDGGGPPPDIDKTTQTRSALRGDLITYRITVRNRGDVPLRGLRACDRVPRALRFVGASRRLHRAGGRRLCLTIPLLRPHQRKTVRATFAVRAGVPAGTVVTNDASADGSGTSPPSPSPPEGAGSKPRRRQLDRDSARFRVRSAAEGPCRAKTANRGARASC